MKPTLLSGYKRDRIQVAHSSVPVDPLARRKDGRPSPSAMAEESTTRNDETLSTSFPHVVSRESEQREASTQQFAQREVEQSTALAQQLVTSNYPQPTTPPTQSISRENQPVPGLEGQNVTIIGQFLRSLMPRMEVHTNRVMHAGLVDRETFTAFRGLSKTGQMRILTCDMQLNPLEASLFHEAVIGEAFMSRFAACLS
ncbi:uncharacterized protein PHACADRAFT_33523 [Phanerochaete carnosa HHB-10118-sp]|uniref:Uncharacterized protein n=1 Tax=Phanerochaete carnosa (strain HHB-10118-sp) TaxID=650164 RepID=K5UIL4_PHACS|nr:uncharacterized protein PHACADRAFT_33523 [Phanerochaete carnosa HHB-10118-sp]EKM49346.1 hypothetical protein PHACADRAFT_33523 [Phanerochaete carnosa HHB-10118-sp]